MTRKKNSFASAITRIEREYGLVCGGKSAERTLDVDGLIYNHDARSLRETLARGKESTALG